jgi:hypothetical protein
LGPHFLPVPADDGLVPLGGHGASPFHVPRWFRSGLGTAWKARQVAVAYPVTPCGCVFYYSLRAGNDDQGAARRRAVQPNGEDVGGVRLYIHSISYMYIRVKIDPIVYKATILGMVYYEVYT